VAGELLLDTGPLVALLNRRERRHQACVRVLESWTGPVVSTEAVLTEATHLLGGLAGGRRACLEFIVEGGAILVPGSLGGLRRARDLMDKYDDVPMDYADATLVVLAEDLDTSAVFTLDVRGFTTYRTRERRPFRILPGGSA
jgi:predicted nucleic acid-binding protein